MSDVLERIRRELQQRLESTRAAAREHERVRAALEALEHAVAPLEKVARRATGGATQAKPGRKPAAASAAKARSAAKSGGRARSQTKRAGTRAPRGANREAVLAVVRERPGVTAREVAAASGVTGGTLYSLLARLTARGELAKRDLPGGQVGYALADSDAPATVAAGADTLGEDGSPTHTGDTATPGDQPEARP